MNLKHVSLIGLVFAIVSIVILVSQKSLLAVGIAGITVQILAALLMVWARLTFGRRSFHAAANPTEGGLVTNGPYRFLRHPIYAALLYFLWAGVLSHPLIMNLLLAVIASGGLAVRMFAEEHLVTERYPAYIAYAERTKRVIPFVF